MALSPILIKTLLFLLFQKVVGLPVLEPNGFRTWFYVLLQVLFFSGAFSLSEQAKSDRIRTDNLLHVKLSSE
jgi:hypothetical protein